MTNQPNNNSELLVWAVANLDRWDDEYTHLRSDNSPAPIFFTIGRWGWRRLKADSDDEWVGDGYFRVISYAPLEDNNPQVITKQEWMEAKDMKTTITTPAETTSKTSQETILGHVHAKAMVEYGQDALTNPEPWKLWQFAHKSDPTYWVTMDTNPSWDRDFLYRRKPKPTPKMIIGGIEVEASPFKPEEGEMYYRVNLLGNITSFNYATENNRHNRWINSNLIFRTQKEADAVGQALISLLQSAQVINLDSEE